MSSTGLVVGALVGKYKITGLLGHGGMSIVYSGLDVSLLRPVAIKLLTSAPDRGKDVVERLLLEARAAARLNHPNVVTLYELQNNSHGCYLVLELLDGGSAQTRLREQGRLPWREATQIIADACRGLQSAHAAKIIHRDVKPSNILLNRQGVAKLSDFGLTLAPQLDGRASSPPNRLLGTPHFMSPEQCTNRDVDERADLYSLGASYFALLTGRPPFDGADATMIMYSHCTQPLPDPRRQAPEIPDACVDVLRRALAKSRLDRYSSTDLMLADLLRVLSPGEWPPTPGARPPLPQEEFPAAISLDVGTRATQESPDARRRWVKQAAACATVGALGLAGWFTFGGRDDSTDVPMPERNGPDRLRSARKSNSPISPTPAERTPRENSSGSLVLRPASLPNFADRGDARSVCIGEQLILAGCADGGLHVFARGDGAYLRTIRHAGEVESVAISDDGKLIVAGGRSSPAVGVWEAATGRALSTFRAASNVCSLAFAATSNKLVVASEKDLVLHEFDSRQSRFRPTARLWERQYVVNQVAFSADGRRLTACTNDNGATAWDWPSLKSRSVPRRPDVSRLTTAAISRHGTRIGLGSHEGIFHLWDVERGESRPVPQVRLGSIAAAVFSPVVDTVVVAGEWGGPLRLFDVDDLRSWTVPTSATGAVRCLNFSRDGNLLGAAFSEGAVRLWRCELATPRA